jgi:hypothetical protein
LETGPVTESEVGREFAKPRRHFNWSLILRLSSINFAATVLLAACAIGCKSETASTKVSNDDWKSQHFDVSASMPIGWRTSHISSPGDTYDRPDGLVAAFLNDSGPFSYIIRVENDSPLEQLSINDYLAAVKSQYQSHPAYTFVDESDLDFHGHVFHRFRFKVTGNKGPNGVPIWIYRDGTHLVTIQMTFPMGSDGVIDVPEPLANFDRGVSVNL